jgi:hypothetical protein
MVKQPFHGKLEGVQLDALTETLKRINWSAGYGEVTMINQDSGQARIERPHCAPTLRSYRIWTDDKRRLHVHGGDLRGFGPSLFARSPSVNLNARGRSRGKTR